MEQKLEILRGSLNSYNLLILLLIKSIFHLCKLNKKSKLNTFYILFKNYIYLILEEWGYFLLMMSFFYSNPIILWKHLEIHQLSYHIPNYS